MRPYLRIKQKYEREYEWIVGAAVSVKGQLWKCHMQGNTRTLSCKGWVINGFEKERISRKNITINKVKVWKCRHILRMLNN